MPYIPALGTNRFLFTSESVSEGHPDKVCDQISDALVDLCLADDPEARCAIETLATTDRIVIAGETRVPDSVTEARIEETVRGVIRDIGYEQDGFHWKTVEITNLLHAQSPDIAQGVDEAEGKEEGAGDQGIMFGYASTETEALMPAPLHYAHEILRRLSEARHAGEYPDLGPDAKCQVTLLYENGAPVHAQSVLVSTQHSEGVRVAEVREMVRPVVVSVLPEGWMNDETQFLVNPTGRFVIGGPDGDAGLTGRKIIVDTYGGAAPHGGGAFSGKDPTKVDRSAAYAMRYLAKNVVAAGLAERCTLQVSYAIGLARPLSLNVNLHDTSDVCEDTLCQVLQNLVDLSPRGIREHLGLNRPIYRPTAAYGHFGRTPDEGGDGCFAWERCDLVEALRKACGKDIRPSQEEAGKGATLLPYAQG